MNKAVSRREFLKTSGGVALFIGVSGLLPQMISCEQQQGGRKTFKKTSVNSLGQIS